jgi:hypothetical protein
MSEFQTLLSLVLLIYILSVFVQAIQELIKKILGTKAAVMRQALERFMGKALSRSDVENALNLRGLNITALENLNKQDFRHLRDGIDFQPAQVQAIVKKAGATIDNLRDNIAGSYEGFRADFQQAYTRRNKIFVLILSFIVVIALNSNLIVLYKLISTDQAARQALVSRTSLPPAVPSASGTASQSAADLLAAVENTRTAIAQDLQQYPILLRTGKLPSEHAEHPWVQVFGLVLMGLLVSLGAPFWNDILKGMTGVNNALNTSGGKASA